MNARNFRRNVFSLLLFTAAGLPSRADAAAMFTVTDLGTSYKLQTDSSGYTHSVTNGDGSQTYVFDKSPVTYDPAGPFTLKYNNYGLFYNFSTPSGTSSSYTVAENQAGKLGFEALKWFGGGKESEGGIYGFWFLSGVRSPAVDLNSSGQIVGGNQPSGSWSEMGGRLDGRDLTLPPRSICGINRISVHRSRPMSPAQL